MIRVFSGVLMRGRRQSFVWAACLVVSVIYSSSYFWLRAQHEFVRTGWLYNARLPSGELAAEGGWRDCWIERPTGAPTGTWLSHAYLPLIATESLFWNTLGRRLRTDSGP